MPGGLMRAAATASMVSTARANRAVRKNIEANTAAVNAASQPAQSAPAPTAPAQDDVTAQLTQLKNLLDQGLITQEEFTAKKAQILGI